MKQKRKATKPVYIGKAFSFDDLIADAREKQRLTVEEFQKTGRCTARRANGSPCTNLGDARDMLCDKCRSEIKKILNELSKDPGFFGVSI